MTTANLNNFSITDADMQTIIDDLAVDMGQINTRISCGRDSVIRSCLMDVDL